MRKTFTAILLTLIFSVSANADILMKAAKPDLSGVLINGNSASNTINIDDLLTFDDVFIGDDLRLVQTGRFYLNHPTDTLYITNISDDTYIDIIGATRWNSGSAAGIKEVTINKASNEDALFVRKTAGSGYGLQVWASSGTAGIFSFADGSAGAAIHAEHTIGGNALTLNTNSTTSNKSPLRLTNSGNGGTMLFGQHIGDGTGLLIDFESTPASAQVNSFTMDTWGRACMGADCTIDTDYTLTASNSIYVGDDIVVVGNAEIMATATMRTILPGNASDTIGTLSNPFWAGYFASGSLYLGQQRLRADLVNGGIEVDSLHIINGIKFSATGFSDADGDTQIQVEESADENIIRFDTNAQERMTIDGTTGNLTVNSYTMLGSDAPVIKMKKVTGTTGATEGSITNIAHGLPDISKIIGLQVLVTQSTENNRVPPSLKGVVEHEYDVYILVNEVRVVLSATNSGNLLNGYISVLLTYEE